MKLLGSFSRHAPNTVFVSVLLGALAGACYALIIPLVLSAIGADGPEFELQYGETGFVGSLQISHFFFFATFVGVCLFILMARTLSQVLLMRVSMDVTREMRLDMYRRIANAPIAELERVGLPRLVACISADVPVIVAGARLLPDLLTNAVTLVGMLGFLLYLNASVFWFTMGCIAAGIVTYQLPMLLARRYLLRARRHLDDLHESIRGLVHGAKELKLHHARREEFFREALLDVEDRVCRTSKTGHTVMRFAQNYGDLIAFFVIGAVAFVLVNYHAISRQELAGIVMALLYITGPVAALLNFVPQFAMATVALQKVEQVFGQLPQEGIAADAAPRRDWQRLRFEGVRYQYAERQGEPGFAVGPLDLEVRKGEIAFIVGGNGSGKSTLAKLITLHYQATAGTLRFDDEAVDASNLAGFRRGVAAIYSDYYLFDRVFGTAGRDIQAEVDDYLKALGLDAKVRFEGGRFSTLALSDGQKRRLALLVAFLEDAELYLFDEWAADQDPHFKAVFYERILPGLKARGKAVVAISHDDRYFHLADRLLVMQEGLLVPADEAALLTGSLLKSAAHAPLLAAMRAADAVATGAQAR